MSTGSQRTVFPDGIGLTKADLDSIGNNVSRRAWETPGYSDLLAFDEIDIEVNPGGVDFETIFNGTAYNNGRARGVFTAGGGLRPSNPTGLISQLGAGMLGVWAQSGVITPPPVSGPCSMMWAWVDGGDATTHTADAAGSAHWEIVTCSMSETNAAPVARDFTDDVTGTVSSQDLVTAVTTTATLAKHSGESKTDGTETLPEVPSGERLLYAVRVAGSAITEVRDYTIPVGQLKRVIQMGMDGKCNATDWTASAPIGFAQHSGTAGTAAYHKLTFFPTWLSGDGCARLLGLRICHNLHSGCTVALKKGATLDGTLTTVKDISASLTMSGTPSESFIDLRTTPIWGGGDMVKGQGATTGGLVLEITPSAIGDGSNLRAVEWIFV